MPWVPAPGFFGRRRGTIDPSLLVYTEEAMRSSGIPERVAMADRMRAARRERRRIWAGFKWRWPGPS